MTVWNNKHNVEPTMDEFLEDNGCSMAGRRSSAGQCGIRVEPCPPKCLLKQIDSLRAQVQAARLMLDEDKPERGKS